ncbi:hypothetical protein [Acidihalobacter prosperus]|uniref:hypothetical protein n=1 Tax=Acidihalobacter prosperus TaxID=160660 RepID=UPI00056FF529|nr:hypothetical protein [Acidihalobacter prosperus]
MKQIHVIRQVRRIVMLMLGGALLAPGLALAGMIYNANGYAPNSSSPVVGGWAQVGQNTPRTCTQAGNIHNHHTVCSGGNQAYYRPFGDVVLLSGQWGPGGTWYNGSLTCPNNTAAIPVTAGGTWQGYMADNGVWYNAVYAWNYGWSWQPAQSVTVCADTDTASGWYGGQ